MARLSSTTCELCGLPVIGRPVRSDDRDYCCEGCRRVDEVARAAGIEVGTSRREGATADRRTDSASRKKAAALAAGARRDTFRVDGMWCASCANVLVEALMALPGVLDAEVSYAASLARVTRDPDAVTRDQVQERFGLLGYSAVPANQASSAPGDTGDLFLRLFVCVVLDMWVSWPTWLAVWPAAAAHGWAAQQPLELFTAAFSLVVLLFGGWPFLKGAWQAARVGRATMDTLIVLGTWTAWLYSAYALLWGGGPTYFDSASMITVIVLLGRWIEAMSSRASRETLSVASRARAVQAWLLRDEDTTASAEQVDIEQIAIGDLIVVRPGELSPADGLIVEGASELDRSLLTGESLPVTCAEGDEIWAQSLNLADPVVVRVTRTGEATLAGRLSAVVEDAAFARTNAERLADAVSSVFVPAVIAGAVLTVVTSLVAGVGLDEAVSRAVAVLVVACPCALALATPVAITNATASAARKGALLRGAPVFERAGTIGIVAFDKTGTLTRGEAAYQGIVRPDPEAVADALDERELLAVAARLESGDPHPVARALAEAVHRDPARPVSSILPDDASVRRVAGEGLEVVMDGDVQWVLGSERLLQRHDVSLPADLVSAAEAARGQGDLIVWLARKSAGVWGLRFSDELRPESAAVVRSLQDRGLRVAMVSGDAAATCRSVAARLGIEDVRAEVLPHEKEAVVRELQASRQVAYVGDGLNDSAALAAADLAIGVEGASDIAVLSADVVLLKQSAQKGMAPTSPLASTLAVLDLAAQTRKVVRQNLVWAFTYNVVAFPLAATGRLSPIWAAAAMAGSSLAVVANSLRLRVTRTPDVRSASEVHRVRYAPSASSPEKSVEPSS